MPWSEVLYEATGETRLDGTALREYFLPLEEWLRNENLRTQEYVGWNYGRRLPMWFIVRSFGYEKVVRVKICVCRSYVI